MITCCAQAIIDLDKDLNEVRYYAREETGEQSKRKSSRTKKDKRRKGKR